MNLTLPDVIILDTASNRPASDADGEGRLFFASDTGAVSRDNGSTWDDVTPIPSNQPYDIACAFIGKPDAGAKVLALTFVRTVTFADEWDGSYGSVGANPTSTAAYSILKNGVACGSVSISTGGVFTFATTSPAGEISFAAGDRMVITAPDPQDATLEDVAFTLVGTR